MDRVALNFVLNEKDRNKQKDGDELPRFFESY
jgi:hypothetical protein